LLATCQRATSPLWIEFNQLTEPAIQKLKKGLEDLNTIGHIESWQDLILNSPMLSECSQHDPSGRMEGNLWKLITHIHEQSRQGILNYSDPMEMALQTDSNNENEARSIRESNQIQLMTIHASKGLEFDHVFLPFLNHTRKKDGAEFWTADLENQNWTTSMIDPNTRETGASYHAQAVAEDIHRLLGEESERLFYVAITRARKGLYFFPPNESHTISASGWARHLQDFLSRGVGQFLSEQGTYEFSIKTIESILPSTFESKSRDMTNIETKGLSIKTEAIIESKSITTLLREDEPLSPSGGPKNKLEVSFIERGIKIHRQLESYCCSKGTSHLPEELTQFLRTAELPLHELLSSGFPEWSFQVQTKTFIVEGQIDLWGRDQKGQVWIVDYKTGSPDYQEKAFQQMRLDAWALRETKQVQLNEKIKLAICYPLSNQCFTRELLPDELKLVKV
jgi:ATP-dependent exoDNAse (exonuclease V) beta subunit